MKVVVMISDEQRKKLAFGLLGVIYLASGFFPRVQRQIRAVRYDLANKNITPKAGQIQLLLLQAAKHLLLAGGYIEIVLLIFLSLWLVYFLACVLITLSL